MYFLNSGFRISFRLSIDCDLNNEHKVDDALKSMLRILVLPASREV